MSNFLSGHMYFFLFEDPLCRIGCPTGFSWLEKEIIARSYSSGQREPELMPQSYGTKAENKGRINK